MRKKSVAAAILLGRHGAVASAPNESLQELEGVVGAEAAREIVRLFLDDFPVSIGKLTHGSPEDRPRMAHGLKSSARHMGAGALSQRMAQIEASFIAGPGPTPEEITLAIRDFEKVAPALRLYAGG